MDGQAVVNQIASMLAGGRQEDSHQLVAALLTMANSIASQSQQQQQSPHQQQQQQPPLQLPQHHPQGGYGQGMQMGGGGHSSQGFQSPGGCSRDFAALSPAEQAVALQDFVKRYPIDSRAYEYLVTSPPAVLAHVLTDFLPPRMGEADYSSLVTCFVKRVRSNFLPGGELGGATPSTGSSNFGYRSGGGGSSFAGARREVPKTLDEFLMRYPIDEKALEVLSSCDSQTIGRVLREFKPPREGEPDYSALVTSFTKRCSEQAGHGGAVQGASGQNQVEYPVAGEGAPKSLAEATVTPGIGDFLLKYPLDERAYEYFTMCSPAVQAKILREFRPPREGEASYSSLFTAFVKRNRNGFAGMASGPASHGEDSLQMNAGGEPNPDLEAFRLRYPMDDRAFEYLQLSGKEVQQKMIESFTPQRPNDRDFSAAITAYVKALRISSQEATAMPSVPELEDMSRFFDRYPCDQRAQEFLHNSPPDVRSRVMREFRPRQEGEQDYSGAVTAFVKRCRTWAQEDQFRSGGRPGFGGGGFRGGGGFGGGFRPFQEGSSFGRPRPY